MLAYAGQHAEVGQTEGRVRKSRITLAIRSALILAASCTFSFDVAAEVTDTKPALVTGRSASVHKKHKKDKAAAPYKGVISKDGVAVLPPPAACSNASARALDKVYGVHGWDIPYPSYGDTMLGDFGCWRTNLAKYGFGILTFVVNQGATNVLSHQQPVFNGPGQGRNQAYWGQAVSGVTNVQTYLTYDLSQYGVPDGQLVVAGMLLQGTDISYAPNQFSIGRLAYYQTFFDKRLEFTAGYMTNQSDFIGAYINGNIANPFGNSVSIPFIAGMSVSPVPAPTARMTWHITDHFYDELAVQRSLVPAQNGILAEHYLNPTGLEFSPSGTIFGHHQNTPSALLINEFGYRNHPTPAEPSTWVRFGQMYNFSDFYNYKSQGVDLDPWATGHSHTYAFYLLGDRQIWQFDNSSPLTAYRGLYIGASAYYAPPETSIVTQTFEGRVYVVGPFAWRPFDLIAATFSHNTLSHYFADDLNNYIAPGYLCHTLQNTCARHATNTWGATYTAKLNDGIYATVGFNYTDHPSFTYTPFPTTGYVKSDLSLVGAIFTSF